MAYDPRRERTVVFGGYHSPITLGGMRERTLLFA